MSYPSDGEHYRIIKIATESTASCQHLKSIIKVDGIPLSKITLKDDFSVDVNGVKYTFSLSSILPSHTNSSKLAMINSNLLLDTKKYLHKMKLNRHGLRPNLSHIFLSIIMHGTRQINIVL